jgi:predicted RNase H-like nuclease (RuvC/YqgF family)
MREEFEKLIGLEISQAEYEPIQDYYMSLPNSIDKQKFAKSWLKDNGIQNLFNKRAEALTLLQLRFNDLANELDYKEKRIAELARRLNEQHDHTQELEKKLAAINAITEGVLA